MENKVTQAEIQAEIAELKAKGWEVPTGKEAEIAAEIKEIKARGWELVSKEEAEEYEDFRDPTFTMEDIDENNKEYEEFLKQQEEEAKAEAEKSGFAEKTVLSMEDVE